MQNLLKEACFELGLQQDVEILRMDKSGRWTLAYTQNPEMPHFGNNMITLERLLKKKSGVNLIDLVLESLEDKNKRAKRMGQQEVKLVSMRGIESLD